MKDDILLPIELASPYLSLEEIGTLFVLMTLPNSKYSKFWSENKRFCELLDYLISEGIVVKNENGNEINMEVDISWV